MVTEPETRCAIWPEYPATKRAVVDGRWVRHLTSERAGGSYIIAEPAEVTIGGIDDGTKARLTTWLVDERRQGNDWPLITEERIGRARARRPLSVDERAVRLLRYLVEQSETLGQHLSLSRTPILAHTESQNVGEVHYLESYLADRGFITGLTMGGGLNATVTVDGHRIIAELAATPDSAQAFVAMWFNSEMQECFDSGILPAVEEAGYRAFRIDQREHINKIDDEIIAEIRRSRFIVADFTHGADGARGSVYYEAGFAHGLGLDVIFTCHRDSFGDLHFDTSHYNHIEWATPEELRQKLRTRILAVIGEGPELHKGS